MMGGKWQKNFTEGTSGAKVDELLQVSSLQRLARERIVEMEVRLSSRTPLNMGLSSTTQCSIILTCQHTVQSHLCCASSLLHAGVLPVGSKAPGLR